MGPVGVGLLLGMPDNAFPPGSFDRESLAVPGMEPFQLGAVIGRSFTNREIKMRNLIVAACCAALVGSVSVASAQTTGAQTTGPAAQKTLKASDPMNAHAMKMKKKHKTKKAAKPDAGMTKDTK